MKRDARGTGPKKIVERPATCVMQGANAGPRREGTMKSRIAKKATTPSADDNRIGGVLPRGPPGRVMVHHDAYQKPCLVWGFPWVDLRILASHINQCC